MGIYVKDIELPKEPDEMIELAIFGDGKTLKTGESWRSPVDGKCYYGTSEDMNTYSAFAVPPHGRLIDADAVFDNLERTGWYDNADRDIAEDLVLDAPTLQDRLKELQKDLERTKDFEAFWQHEAEEALRKYQVAISRKPQWIPVTERLPNEYVSVLCYCSRNDQYGCGEWCKEDNGTICWIGLNGMIPTHWKPLPEPPKEET